MTVSGATVRLTGSGLGCENWPRCGEQFLPEQGYHAYVEFGNRVVGFLVGLTTLAAAIAAWRMRVPRRLFYLALTLPLLVLAQGVLGGITVLVELNPVIVMSHFLLSLVGVALAVVLVLETELWIRRSGPPEVPRRLCLARARPRPAGARPRRLGRVRDRRGARIPAGRTSSGWGRWWTRCTSTSA